MKEKSKNRLGLIFTIWMMGVPAAINAGPYDSGNGNPLLPGYFADPSSIYDNGAFYIFSTTDGYGWDAGPASLWRSTDFVHWTNTKLNWPTGVGLWAPSVIKALNGRFYMYEVLNGNSVQVGVADSPSGPWQNAKAGNSLLLGSGDYSTNSIDAEAYIDNDGQAYLYWGNGAARAVKLMPDMVTFDGPVAYLSGTRWAANGSGKPQWLEVDLGQNYTVTGCETYFEFSDRYYQYLIEYSTNNVNWFTFADRRSNTAIGNPYGDTNTQTARYVRITITNTQNSGDWASIGEFIVYSGTNPISQGTTATASSSYTGYPPGLAVDGNYSGVPHYVEAPYMLKRNGIYYLMYSDGGCADSTYKVRYAIGSAPFGPWTEGLTSPILTTNSDNTVDGPGHHSMLKLGNNYYIVYHRHDNPHSSDGIHRQVCIDPLVFNVDGTIAKVVPTHTGVGALGPLSNNDTNLARGRIATASSTLNAYHTANYACDENYGTHWAASTASYPQWFRVDLGQNYSVDRCEIFFEYPTLSYRYRIDYSTDNVNWFLYADRSLAANAGCPYNDIQSVSAARYFRVTVTGCENSAMAASVWEFKVFKAGAVNVNRSVERRAPEALPFALTEKDLRRLQKNPSVHVRVFNLHGRMVSFSSDAEKSALSPGIYLFKVAGAVGRPMIGTLVVGR